MRSPRLLALGLVLLTGCAADPASEEDSEVDGADAELNASDVPGVRAILVETRRPPRLNPTSATLVAFAPKVAAMMRALPRTTSSAGASTPVNPDNGPSANDSTPACHPTGPAALPVTTLTFLDKNGLEVGKGSIVCRRGSITPKNGARFQVTQLPAFQDAIAAPLVPSDILFGVDEIEVTRRETGKPKRVDRIREASAIGKVFDAMKLDSLGNGAPPTCETAVSLAFKRRGGTVASGGYRCVGGSGTSASRTTMSFEATDPRIPQGRPLVGTVEIAPAGIERLLP